MKHELIEIPGGGFRQRPYLLKYLCVATWIGSAVTVMLALILFSLTCGSPDGNGPVSWTNRTIAVECVGALLCTAGAAFMWNGTKNGFYVYAAGQTPVLLVIFLIVRQGAEMPLDWFTLLLAVVFSVVPLALLFLYARTLKYLR